MDPGLVVAKRYRLERQLGAGGMGAVWAATHVVTHKVVALKFLHKKHDDPDARRRVLREARAACAVQHPNVVAVHDVIEDEEGTPILVMDLLRGESLAQKLTREGTLAPGEAVAILTPVLSALSAAHAVGIVHRDLKPDNVFLVDGISSNVRILDFGVAKLSGKDAATKETNRLTETGAMIGTPHYMAPEQAFGESDVDARADLWAVGAVFYECLAGVPPTEGQNLGQILKVLASGSIKPLSTRAPSAPPALAAIVDRLLAIEKADRPESAVVVLEQLTALGSDALAAPAPELRNETPASATIDPIAITPAPKPRRRAAPWIAAGAATLALASAIGIFGSRLRTPTAHASVAVPVATTAEPPPPPAASTPVASAQPTPVVAEPAATAPAASAARKPKVAPATPDRPTKPVEKPAAAKPGDGTPLIAEPTF